MTTNAWRKYSGHVCKIYHIYYTNNVNIVDTDQRQESSSRDRRRLILSNKRDTFALPKQKSHSQRLSHKLPRIQDYYQEPPNDTQLLHVPSLHESITAQSNSPSRSRSNSNSFSYEESQVGRFYMQQESVKKSHQFNYIKRYPTNTLNRPSNLPAISPPVDDDEDDEIADERMEKILMTCMPHTPYTIYPSCMHNPNLSQKLQGFSACLFVIFYIHFFVSLQISIISHIQIIYIIHHIIDQRQESSSKDKRRSISSNKSRDAFALLKQKSPSQRLSHKLPRIQDNYQEPPNKPSSITKKGTRGRRAETIQPIATSPSLSASTFVANAKCNEVQGQVPLMQHIEKWQSMTMTETEEPTPSPLSVVSPATTKVARFHTRLKSTPIDEDTDFDLVGVPMELDPAKSTPNVLSNSNTSIANLRVSTKIKNPPKIPHLASSSVNLDLDEDLINEVIDDVNGAPWDYLDGSMTPQISRGRGRRSTLRPKGHTPVISRGFSESEVFRGMVDSADVDIKSDANIQSSDDDEDYKDDPMEIEQRKVNERQSTLVSYNFIYFMFYVCSYKGSLRYDQVQNGLNLYII